MKETIDVLFGSSDIYPDTIIVKKVECVGYYKGPDGEPVGPMYDSEAESWLARTDMNCAIYSIDNNSFEELAERYSTFVKAAWEKTSKEDEVWKLKEEFLSMAESN